MVAQEGVASRDEGCLGDTLLTRATVSPDVGMCPGAPGGGGAAVPLGPAGAGRPRHPGAAATGPGTCPWPPGPGHPPRGAAGVTHVPTLSPARPAHPLPALCQPRHRYGTGTLYPPCPLSLCPFPGSRSAPLWCGHCHRVPSLLLTAVTVTIFLPVPLSPFMGPQGITGPLQSFPAVSPVLPQHLCVPRCPSSPSMFFVPPYCVPCASHVLLVLCPPQLLCVPGMSPWCPLSSPHALRVPPSPQGVSLQD